MSAMGATPTPAEVAASPCKLGKGDARFRAQFRKTELCVFFNRGWCSKGERCEFAHGEQEIQHAPDLKKTSLCKQWQRQACPLPSEECPYAHGPRELRVTSAFADELRRRGKAARAAGSPQAPPSQPQERSDERRPSATQAQSSLALPFASRAREVDRLPVPQGTQHQTGSPHLSHELMPAAVCGQASPAPPHARAAPSQLSIAALIPAPSTTPSTSASASSQPQAEFFATSPMPQSCVAIELPLPACLAPGCAPAPAVVPQVPNPCQALVLSVAAKAGLHSTEDLVTLLRQAQPMSYEE